MRDPRFVLAMMAVGGVVAIIWVTAKAVSGCAAEMPSLSVGNTLAYGCNQSLR